jgi:hypothetical protein
MGTSDSILSSTLEEAISAAKHKTNIKHPSFHMSSYLLDVMGVIHSYPGMGWEWKTSDHPIHIYFQNIWEHHSITTTKSIFNRED